MLPFVDPVEPPSLDGAEPRFVKAAELRSAGPGEPRRLDPVQLRSLDPGELRSASGVELRSAAGVELRSAAGVELRSPGRLEVIGRTNADARAASEIALAAFARAPRHSGFVDVLGETAYFKMSALRGKSAVRYALRRGILRLRLPRLREYANLAWLRDHGFRAPEPIAAGAMWRRGLPRFQFLFTRAVEAVETLSEFLGSPREEEERSRVLDDLAREVARMHALGFVHHDLYGRNLLVAPPRRGHGSSHVWFLDCWAGGPRPQMRGPTYDYGCLMADAAITWEERERFREVYTAERNARGRPIGRSELVLAIERARARRERRGPGSAVARARS